ncbi:MAG: 5'/3'-nucleotidase SurE [Treponema sp.]|jgi:5'-nucleotidase|nr:5'/3'-nucleotidase SurE [Treponema sp.]
MTILLTNDDGIASPGLDLLAVSLRSEGHRVFVLAPDRNRSGVSHSISFLSGPIRLKEHGADTWSCPGLPADCVITALLGGLPGLDGLPDMVVSGINRGANIGTDIIYSGTAAAARQASFWDLPSVALSLVEGDTYYWDMAVSYSVRHIEDFRALWQADTFINVNIPNRAEYPSGMERTFPSLRIYHDTLSSYEGPDGRLYCFFRSGETDTPGENGSDWDAVSRGMASASAVFIHPVVASPGGLSSGRKKRASSPGLRTRGGGT